MNILYPRMLAIHDLAADAGFPASNGRLKMPQFMRASYAYMVADGAYLLCQYSPYLSADVQRMVRWRCCGLAELSRPRY